MLGALFWSLLVQAAPGLSWLNSPHRVGTNCLGWTLVLAGAQCQGNQGHRKLWAWSWPQGPQDLAVHGDRTRPALLPRMSKWKG